MIFFSFSSLEEARIIKFFDKLKNDLNKVLFTIWRFSLLYKMLSRPTF